MYAFFTDLLYVGSKDVVQAIDEDDEYNFTYDDFGAFLITLPHSNRLLIIQSQCYER